LGRGIICLTRRLSRCPRSSSRRKALPAPLKALAAPLLLATRRPARPIRFPHSCLLLRRPCRCRKQRGGRRVPSKPVAVVLMTAQGQGQAWLAGARGAVVGVDWMRAKLAALRGLSQLLCPASARRTRLRGFHQRGALMACTVERTRMLSKAGRQLTHRARHQRRKPAAASQKACIRRPP